MKKRIFVAVVVGLAGVTIFMGYVILVGSAIFAADMLNNRDPFFFLGFTATAERAFAASPVGVSECGSSAARGSDDNEDRSFVDELDYDVRRRRHG